MSTYYNWHEGTEKFNVAVIQAEDILQATVTSYILGEEETQDIPNLVSLYSAEDEREAFLISQLYNKMRKLGIKPSCLNRVAKSVRIQEEEE